jgi:hypothetical protein
VGRYKIIVSSRTDKFLDEPNEKLQQAQETGLIKKQIINLQDEPFLGWKTQLSLRKSEERT